MILTGAFPILNDLIIVVLSGLLNVVLSDVLNGMSSRLPRVGWEDVTFCITNSCTTNPVIEHYGAGQCCCSLLAIFSCTQVKGTLILKNA